MTTSVLLLPVAFYANLANSWKLKWLGPQFLLFTIAQ
uniref:Uncharacterized protein n=1 Tax=Arundo donax TaxID=35708 RepID=A0A0A9AAV2_ARUDO